MRTKRSQVCTHTHTHAHTHLHAANFTTNLAESWMHIWTSSRVLKLVTEARMDLERPGVQVLDCVQTRDLCGGQRHKRK